MKVALDYDPKQKGHLHESILLRVNDGINTRVEKRHNSCAEELEILYVDSQGLPTP